MNINRSFVFLLASLLLAGNFANAQKIENVIVVTTDGFRWQEVFKGMDTAIANNKEFNQGERKYIFNRYAASTDEERREKLLPFFWSTLQSQGRLYGNRKYGNNVNVANPYWFSYPGYSEIFTGYADTAVNSNGYKANPNVNVLEFINKQPVYKNKVEAFGAWDAFNRILNEGRCGFPVVAAYDKCGGNKPTANEQLINKMLSDSYKPFGTGECLDVFTHYEAIEALTKRKPKVLYIAYGETDEWAHEGRYKDYLDAAHQVDAWIKEIWDFVQNDPQYKNKTALLVTCDHGRGDKNKNQWADHGSDVPGANEIWFGVIAPGVSAKGEMKTSGQLYQQQFAQTIAAFLGLKFTADHSVAEGIGIRN